MCFLYFPLFLLLSPSSLVFASTFALRPLSVNAFAFSPFLISQQVRVRCWVYHQPQFSFCSHSLTFCLLSLLPCPRLLLHLLVFSLPYMFLLHLIRLHFFLHFLIFHLSPRLFFSSYLIQCYSFSIRFYCLLFPFYFSVGEGMVLHVLPYSYLYLILFTLHCLASFPCFIFSSFPLVSSLSSAVDGIKIASRVSFHFLWFPFLHPHLFCSTSPLVWLNPLSHASWA